MEVTILQNIKNLAEYIKSDFPYNYTVGDGFRWSSNQKIIYHPAILRKQDLWDLMHEIGHAQLGHTSFDVDIELIKIESEAWEYAKTHIAPRYDIKIDIQYIEDQLNTYRQWLHNRSTCPICGQNGIQKNKTKIYSCLNCKSLWRSNDARLCGLKRTKLYLQSS